MTAPKIPKKVTDVRYKCPYCNHDCDTEDPDVRWTYTKRKQLSYFHETCAARYARLGFHPEGGK